MKTPIITAASALINLIAITATPLTAAHASEASTLKVDITNIESTEGTMMIALFKGEESWTTHKAIKAQAVPVTANTFEASFSNLEPGVYGLKVFHDVNADGKLNTKLLGIPKEPYAFSNDAPVRFGPPKWDAAKFEIKAGETSHTLTLK